MSNIVKRTITVILSLAVIGYIAYQVLAHYYSAYKTEITMSYSDSDTIITSGVAVRDETVVYAQSKGISNYLVKNGERVRKGSVVASVYEKESDILLQTQINQMESELEVLEESQSAAASAFGYVDLVNGQIAEALGETIDLIQSNDCSGLQDKKTKLTTLLNKRRLCIGEVTDYSSQISSLSEQIQTLQGQVSNPVETVTAESSGYFVNALDGYEQQFSVDSMPSLTVDQINRIIENTQISSEQPADGAIGKVISGFDWYLAVVIKKDSISQFTLNSTMTISFPYATLNDIPVVVSQITEDSSGDYVVIFQCGYMSSELSTLRLQTVSIHTRNISGLRVNNKAIRFKDGIKGVYVLDNKEVIFKPVTVLYTEEHFSVCKSGTSSDELQLYDEIIVEGKGLDSAKQ